MLLLLTAQRAFELLVAARNTRRLRSRGAYEAGAEHYPLMVALHASWLATLWTFGRRRTLSQPFVAAFAVLQAARLWVLGTLGERWTTRIIVLPGAARIDRGPYRFLSHPNYAIVALELPCVSLALGMARHAAVFGALNLAMLSRRISVEHAALRDAQPPDHAPTLTST